MTNIIIILVMLTVLMGAGAYAMVSSMKTLQANIEKLMIEDRMEEAAQGVLNNIVSTTTSATQTYNIPAPDDLTAPAVPSWISPNAQTPRGVKFLYCPFSNTSGSGSTVTTPSGSYAVTIGTLYSGSQNYVTASAPRPANASSALAIIVAPGPNRTTAPDCQNVSSTGTLAGAQVRIITEAEVQSRLQVVASAGNEFNVGASASGDYTGRNSSNAASFFEVMTYVNQFRPQWVKLNMASGAYYLKTYDIGQSNLPGRQISAVRNHSIDFSGAGSASTLLYANASGTLSPYFFGNVRMANLGIPGGNPAAGATFGYVYRALTSNLGNILVDGSTQVQWVLAAAGGKVYWLGNTTMAGNNNSESGTKGSTIQSAAEIYVDGVLTLPISANLNWLLFIGNNGPITSMVWASNSNVVGPASASYNWLYGLPSNEFTLLGTITQTGGSNASSTLLRGFTGSRFSLSGATLNNLNQNGLIVTFGTAAFDRGTVIRNVSNTPNRYIFMYPPSEVLITNSTFGASGARPNFSNIITNNTYQADGLMLGGGGTGGWTTSSLFGAAASSCSEASTVNTNFNLITDSPTGSNGATTTFGFMPRGGSSYEPLIFLNRAGWTCVR